MAPALSNMKTSPPPSPAKAMKPGAQASASMAALAALADAPSASPPENNVTPIRCRDNSALEKPVCGDVLARFQWQLGKHFGSLVVAGSGLENLGVKLIPGRCESQALQMGTEVHEGLHPNLGRDEPSSLALLTDEQSSAVASDCRRGDLAFFTSWANDRVVVSVGWAIQWPPSREA